MSNTILEAKQLEKQYTIGDEQVKILQSVSLKIETGEFVVISGSSGGGKTTLLTLLSGLDRPSSGEVILAGQKISQMSEDALAPVRNKLIGFVFQAFYLVPSLTAFENVTFPAELNKDPNAKDKATALLKRVGLWQRRGNYPSQLSGGEKQRVAICRALINEPAIVFADEPTGNLDSKNSEEIMSILRDLHQERNTTFLLATHSKELSNQAERIIHLHDGRVSESMTAFK